MGYFLPLDTQPVWVYICSMAENISPVYTHVSLDVAERLRARIAATPGLTRRAFIQRALEYYLDALDEMQRAARSPDHAPHASGDEPRKGK